MWQSQCRDIQRLKVKRREFASLLRDAFTKLGVTFIKLGQFLSVRRDILPLELAEELSLLQDQVPPFSFDEAKAIIEKELGAPLSDIFQYFQCSALASASIGQVHKAILKTGDIVAVKVQRPHLSKVINQDLAFMRALIRIGKVFHLKGDWQSWSDLTDEFEKTLLAEMNYLKEGQNADKLRHILREFPAVIIPRVFWQHTSKCVITEELFEGIKVDKVEMLEGLDLKRLARQIAEVYIYQITQYSYFHADPHAGNLAVTQDGQLIIYDFGMMGYINVSQKEGMAQLVLAVVRKNLPGFIDALGKMGVVRPISKKEKTYLETVIEPVWAQFIQSSTAAPDLAKIEREMDVILANQYFRLPANLAYLIRMGVAIEAMVRKLDPNFNFVRIVTPYFRKIIKS